MSVQTWADGFGNWHALVKDEAGKTSQGRAYAAIFRELEERAGGSYEIDTERFRVEMVAESGGFSEWVEVWEGDRIPHSATAVCGHCGRVFPDIYPSARCPFEYDHAEEPRAEVIAQAEALANSRGLDPNNEEIWQSLIAEIVMSGDEDE